MGLYIIKAQMKVILRQIWWITSLCTLGFVSMGLWGSPNGWHRKNGIFWLDQRSAPDHQDPLVASCSHQDEIFPPLAVVLLPTMEAGKSYVRGATEAHGYLSLLPEAQEELRRLGIVSFEKNQIQCHRDLSVVYVVNSNRGELSFDEPFHWRLYGLNDDGTLAFSPLRGPVAIKLIPSNGSRVEFTIPADGPSDKNSLWVRSLPNGFLLRNFPMMEGYERWYDLQIFEPQEFFPFVGFHTLIIPPDGRIYNIVQIFSIKILHPVAGIRHGRDISSPQRISIEETPPGNIEALLRLFTNKDVPCYAKQVTQEEVEELETSIRNALVSVRTSAPDIAAMDPRTFLQRDPRGNFLMNCMPDVEVLKIVIANIRSSAQWKDSAKFARYFGGLLHQYAWIENSSVILNYLLTESGLKTAIDELFNDKTPLTWAASSGRIKNTTVLLDHGADIMQVDYSGNTVVHHILKDTMPNEDVSKILQLILAKAKEQRKLETLCQIKCQDGILLITFLKRLHGCIGDEWRRRSDIERASLPHLAEEGGIISLLIEGSRDQLNIIRGADLSCNFHGRTILDMAQIMLQASVTRINQVSASDDKQPPTYIPFLKVITSFVDQLCKADARLSKEGKTVEDLRDPAYQKLGDLLALARISGEEGSLWKPLSQAMKGDLETTERLALQTARVCPEIFLIKNQNDDFLIGKTPNINALEVMMNVLHKSEQWREQAKFEQDFGGLLHQYAKREDGANALNYLLTKGRLKNSINSKSRDGRTPLIRASEAGNVDNIIVLLNHGADFMQTDLSHNTVVHNLMESSTPGEKIAEAMRLILAKAKEQRKLKTLCQIQGRYGTPLRLLPGMLNKCGNVSVSVPCLREIIFLLIEGSIEQIDTILTENSLYNLSSFSEGTILDAARVALQALKQGVSSQRLSIAFNTSTKEGLLRFIPLLDLEIYFIEQLRVAGARLSQGGRLITDSNAKAYKDLDELLGQARELQANLAKE